MLAKEQQAKGQPRSHCDCFASTTVGDRFIWLPTNIEYTSVELTHLQVKSIGSDGGSRSKIRSLKQTFGRSKLLGRTPEVAIVELSWSILGLWMAQLFAMKEQADLMEPDSRQRRDGAVSERLKGTSQSA